MSKEMPDRSAITSFLLLRSPSAPQWLAPPGHCGVFLLLIAVKLNGTYCGCCQLAIVKRLEGRRPICTLDRHHCNTPHGTTFQFCGAFLFLAAVCRDVLHLY